MKEIKTGECEHCVPRVLYESERCKLEVTKRGKLWTLYNDCTQLEAINEYNKSKEGQDGTNKTGR